MHEGRLELVNRKPILFHHDNVGIRAYLVTLHLTETCCPTHRIVLTIHQYVTIYFVL